MSNDDKIRTGLWKKDGQNGGAPYYSGKIEVNGQEFWVNLYKNDRKESDSQPDLNLQLKPKDASAAKPAARQAPANDFESDSIPF